MSTLRSASRGPRSPSGRRAALALLCAGPLLPLSGLAPARENGLPALTSLADDTALVRKTGMPILVLVSIEGCPYCERIRRQHLIPLAREVRPGVLIREVDMQSTRLIRETAGTSVSQAEWARRHAVRFAPTVLLLGVGGELLAEPLVGASIPDFYGAYLEERIRAAQAKLAAPG